MFIFSKGLKSTFRLILVPMKIEVPYGVDEILEAEIPDINLVGIVEPNEVEFKDGFDEIRDSLDNPIDSPELAEFLKGSENPVFILNDGTRPTPSSRVLDVLSTRINMSFPKYLIATGAHRAPTEDEYLFIFGRFYDMLRGRVHAHDSRKDRTVYLGDSKNGTEMWINEIAVDADRLIIITSVEPHYFAGYTGGRKSILPGVASFDTIEQNHKLAMREEAQSLSLRGNPVNEDMVDALKVLEGKEIFAIQIVLDRHHNIYKVASGNLSSSFKKAVTWAKEVFSVDVGEKVDAVISVAPYPMDVDLYQSQKAMDNAKWALKEGGKLILVSKCRDGIGHDTFYKQLSMSEDPSVILENLKKEYQLGFHKAAKLAEVALWADLWAITDLDPGTLSKANIRPFDSLQAAVDAVLQWKEDAKILVLMNGSVTVPRVD
jgi:nickel-dependent lactate racemase